jgi:hypothetical protein
MQIFIEFRMTSILPAGLAAGIKKDHMENSIRWKEKPAFMFEAYEFEDAVFDIYPVGTYESVTSDHIIKTLIVKAVYRKDPTVEIFTQVGGFEPVEDSSSNIIYDIPLHITTIMQEQDHSFYGIDNISPMEGGIRAALDGFTPWAGDPDQALAEAKIEYNVVHNLYKYIPFVCKDYGTTTTETTSCGIG